MYPCPLHVRVTAPGPVTLMVLPRSRFPLNPGATMWHEGAGRLLGVSEGAFTHVIVTGPVMLAVAGCTPALSDVAWRACTFPRGARCGTSGSVAEKPDTASE